MTGAPVRTALPFARSQLSSSGMLYARLHSKNAAWSVPGTHSVE